MQMTKDARCRRKTHSVVPHLAHIHKLFRGGWLDRSHTIVVQHQVLFAISKTLKRYIVIGITMSQWILCWMYPFVLICLSLGM